MPKNPKNSAKKLYVVGVPEYAEIFHLIYYGSALKTPAKKVRSFVRPIIINVRYSPRLPRGRLPLGDVHVAELVVALKAGLVP